MFMFNKSNYEKIYIEAKPGQKAIFVGDNIVYPPITQKEKNGDIKISKHAFTAFPAEYRDAIQEYFGEQINIYTEEEVKKIKKEEEEAEIKNLVELEFIDFYHKILELNNADYLDKILDFIKRNIKADNQSDYLAKSTIVKERITNIIK